MPDKAIAKTTRLSSRRAVPPPRTRLPGSKQPRPAPMPTMQDPAPPPEPTYTTKSFWPLMEQWEVADEMALRLLGHRGGMASTGRRPRFTLDPDETRRLLYLREIATNLEVMFGDGGRWLKRPADALPFRGQAPLDYMISRGMPGIAEVLRFLGRWGFAATL